MLGEYEDAAKESIPAVRRRARRGRRRHGNEGEFFYQARR